MTDRCENIGKNPRGECGGALGPWRNDSPGGKDWWYRECSKCGYAWAEWKLVQQGKEPHDAN